MSDDPESEDGDAITVERRSVGNFLAGGIVGSILTWGGMKSITGSGTSEESASTEIQLENRPYLGQKSGAVTIVYYMDFQCPFCEQFEERVLPQITSTYRSSNLYIVIKPLGELAVDSRRAAIAAHCGWEQVDEASSYWQWHNALKNSYSSDTESGWAKTENLVPLAKDTSGIDAESFRSCHNEERHNIRVVDDKKEASSFGMNGTPFFVIYGDDISEARTISGAQPFRRFRTVIEEYLQ